MPIPRSLLTAACTALALALTVPAHAATKKVQDLSDDFPPPPEYNLTGARFTSDAESFRARLFLEDLMAPKLADGMLLSIRGLKTSKPFQIQSLRDDEGRIRNRVNKPRFDEYEYRKCRGMTATWSPKRDRVDLSVPWSCLGNLRADLRVQVGSANTDGVNGEGIDGIREVRVNYK